ncbi:chalcone isomerase family protein [Aquabacterium sp.]|uniref:chalcone isomerase family protein n=1 Tax=Aquabacterium sp. TaxID=1872578 RepID=UPI002E35919E|nr:chalcone isomerase family protein [Aquabacterium sp.]HEX5310819.1 chalcone isomerase family protein [Aquabacterium sp.]
MMKSAWIDTGRKWMTSLLWAAAVGLGATGTAWSQSAEMVGVNYPGALRVEGVSLVLNGSGVSYRGMSKQYTVGLYTPRKSDRVETALAGFNSPLQLRFVMLQNLRMDELGMAITRGMEANSERDEFFRLVPAIRTMGDVFSRIKRLEAGDTLAIEYVPRRGTMFLVNEQPVGLPIADPTFFQALTRVWLGKKPVTQDLKDALLDFRPPPVLEALR